MRLLLALFVSLCAGCAMNPPPLDPGEELAIISEKKAEVTVTNTDIGKGAAVGGAVGVGGGALVGMGIGAAAAVFCGPFYALCLPNMVAIGAGAGAVSGGVTGGIAGGTVGVMIGISEENKKRLLANLGQMDAHKGLADAIESRARARWKLVPAPAPNELIVRLDKVDLRAAREKEVALALTATVLWKDKDVARPQFKTYEYLGPAAPFESWIENRDGFIARTFDQGYASLADDLMADLEGKSRR